MGTSGGREVAIRWQGRRVRAFVPSMLAVRDLTLDHQTVSRSAAAAVEVTHAASELTADVEPLARLLLRAEGVASSYIEGVRAPVVDVVLAEEGVPSEAGAAALVAANLAAVTDGVAAAATTPLSVDLLCHWHRTLMTGSPMPSRRVGAIRTEQGWIGGTDPTTAHLVTPPPDYLTELVDDLVSYANRDDVDPVTQAAVAHAQFEVIHPFADGNGRVGRVLVAWLLTRRLSLLTPPPVSVALAADVGGYASGLALFRLGQHDPWIRWFADAVRSGGQAQRALIAEVEMLRRHWLERLGARNGRVLRRDAAAWAVLDVLTRHLILTADVLTAELGITNKAAIAALTQLAQAGVLLEYPALLENRRGRPPRVFVSTELLGLVGASPLR